jgi:hypothetical protein
VSAPPPNPSRMGPGRIIGLVLLGGVVVCGLVGSCLLVLNLVLSPFMLAQ